MTDPEPAIYRDLMRFKPDAWTANAWAVKAGVSRTVWSDLRRHGNPSRRTLEKLLAAAGSSLAEFEALRVGEAVATGDGGRAGLSEPSAGNWRPASALPLPVVAVTAGAPFVTAEGQIDTVEVQRAKIVDHLQRPAALVADRGAYAITTLGSAMLPRFRVGRYIAISPAATVAPGDDVLVSLSASSALIAELVERGDAGLTLRQFNPALTFRVAREEIAAVHRIAGELI